jgi:hypothetical protein
VDATGTYFCLVPACVGIACSKAVLQSHFLQRHPKNLVCFPTKGSLPLPQCNRCGLQITYAAMNGHHYKTALCRDGVARRVQHAAAERAQLSPSQMFTTYGKELERVEVFKYLGRLLAYNDSNAQAVRGNLKKGHAIWSRLSCIIRSENASSRACSIFYKATVQSVLLLGSKTWNLSQSTLKLLEGFHIRATWHMADKRLMRLLDGTWAYPNLAQVLEDIGIKTVARYIAVGRQHIANYIVNKPIFTTCVNGGRRQGSSNRHFWWEQSMDLEAALVACFAGPAVVSDDEEENC